jgi:competence protein ComEC
MKRWPLHKAYFWETAPFFRILLPFAAGILCYDRFFAASSVQTYIVPIAGALFILYGTLVIVKKRRGVYEGILFAVLQALMFFFGVAIACFNDVRNDKGWFGNKKGSDKSYVVRITDAPAEKEHSWKVPVSVLRSIKDGRVEPERGRAFLYLYKDMQPMLLHKGDTILVPNKWQLIHNSGNPFEFDYATYCRRNNVWYQQNCSVKDVRLYATNDVDRAPVTERVHDWCMVQLDTYLKDSTAKGLIQAMLLGDEVNLDEELKQSYAATGIIHIIAISGGNVLIFFSVISILLWWLKDRRHLWVKYALAMPLVWFYVIMAGAPPSAVRAAIMFSLLAFSVMLQQNNSNLNTLFAAAFVLLCGEPMWLFSVGFQLSFTAVLSLILFYKPVYNLALPTNKIARGLWSAVTASIAAEILTAPLAIYYFHTFPLLFLVANVAAYVFMGIVLVMGMLIIAASFVPVVATLTGIVVVWLVTIFDHIVNWLQGFNPESFRFLMISSPELSMLYVAVTALAVFLIKKHKAGLFIALASCCMLLVCLCQDEWTSLQQRSIIVYNTGKTNYVELINGKRYAAIANDTSTKKTTYATTPAHINLHAWRQDSAKEHEVFSIKGKTVLILKRDVQVNGSFPVDYLIVNFAGKPNVPELKRVFSPTVTVIGNSYSRKQQSELVKEFVANGLKVHRIANDGAFVVL